MEEKPVALGDVIRLWRAELGWSIKELVRRTGGVVAHSAISDLEHNRFDRPVDPTGKTWAGLAQAFGVSIDVLWAAAAAPVKQIPSVAEVLPPDLAGLPGWAREFHRWGNRLSAAQRTAMLDMARALAMEALERERAEMPQNTEPNPGDEQNR